MFPPHAPPPPPYLLTFMLGELETTNVRGLGDAPRWAPPRPFHRPAAWADRATAPTTGFQFYLAAAFPTLPYL